MKHLLLKSLQHYMLFTMIESFVFTHFALEMFVFLSARYTFISIITLCSLNVTFVFQIVCLIKCFICLSAQCYTLCFSTKDLFRSSRLFFNYVFMLGTYFLVYIQFQLQLCHFNIFSTWCFTLQFVCFYDCIACTLIKTFMNSYLGRITMCGRGVLSTPRAFDPP